MQIPTAAPTLQRAREMAEVSAAMAEIRIMSSELLLYVEINFAPPPSLAAIDRASLLDPWGSPYYYLAIAGQGGNGGGGSGGGGQVRKNKFLVPLNTDFDLYSAGPDGETRAPLTAKVSKDDVLRALDGGFFGIAEDF